MNETISATRRNTFWPLFRDYILAVARYWYAIVVGVGLSWLDLVERVFGKSWNYPWWARLTSMTLGLATAQFLAYRDLRLAHLGELEALQDERERESQRRNTEKEDLLRQIAALRVKPYNAGQIELAKDKLRGLDKTTLNVVKFLLQNGPTGRDSMDSQLSCPQSVLDGAVSNLRQRLLIIPEERPNIGRSSTTTFWSINPKFDEILRYELFESL